METSTGREPDPGIMTPPDHARRIEDIRQEADATLHRAEEHILARIAALDPEEWGDVQEVVRLSDGLAAVHRAINMLAEPHRESWRR